MGFGTREKMADPPPFNPAVGVTASERYLGEMCKRSFLSLWSYSATPSHPLEQVVSIMGQRISPSPAAQCLRNGVIGMWLQDSDNLTAWPKCDLHSRRGFIGHSALLALGTGCLDAGHQISNGSFEFAEPMRQARRNHDYIARPHPAALATLNGASDAGAGGF
jgi:hypothetical protein